MKNELRIIGGRWRSRKLKFPQSKGLRPTPDRVRETLFNWLQGEIEGAACLDLYAGSGALGFEAASRGAARVVQVENVAVVYQNLLQNRAILQANSVEVIRSDVGRFLSDRVESFDVVFLDPPFRQGLVIPCCQALETQGWLKPRAKIYIETEKELALQGLPPFWQLLRDGKSGEVSYYLWERNPSLASPPEAQ
jgi:16S rRNA (guanine966-N2)-methyltransferase